MVSQPRTDTVSPTTAQRYRDVKERIAAAARRDGRNPADVLLVAVSKYADIDQVRELIQLGHSDFAESRAQQLVQRAAMVDELMQRHRSLPGVSSARLADLARRASGESAAGRLPGAAVTPGVGQATDIRWHMIGHLQRNKVKKVLGVARLIHSVDSLRLVEEIQAIAFKRDEVVDVLVQVNCSGERTKYGCAVAAAMHLCEQIETMVHLRVRGVMTMAPYSENPEDSRLTFERCREVYEDIRRKGSAGPNFNILSMGMSGDFEVAISCGSNLVRVGSALFGDRPHAEEHDETEDED